MAMCIDLAAHVLFAHGQAGLADLQFSFALAWHKATSTGKLPSTGSTRTHTCVAEASSWVQGSLLSPFPEEVRWLLACQQQRREMTWVKLECVTARQPKSRRLGGLQMCQTVSTVGL
eukprot:5884348-Amphidinium_carterae.1